MQDGERIFLPRNASLSRLESLSRLLSPVPQRNPAIDDAVRGSSPAQKAFLDRISGHFHSVMHYEDPNLQRKARRLIPIAQLDIAVMKKIRELQRSIRSAPRIVYSSKIYFRSHAVFHLQILKNKRSCLLAARDGMYRHRSIPDRASTLVQVRIFQMDQQSDMFNLFRGMRI